MVGARVQLPAAILNNPCNWLKNRLYACPACEEFIPIKMLVSLIDTTYIVCYYSFRYYM